MDKDSDIFNNTYANMIPCEVPVLGEIFPPRIDYPHNIFADTLIKYGFIFLVATIFLLLYLVYIFRKLIYHPYLTGNNWYTTKQSGTRIYSNGTKIGGNYWTNPSATGFSDNCTDADLDGFCDSAYQLAPNNTDHLPYSNAFTPGICECDSCSLCTSAMNDPSCKIIKLVSDIGGSVSTCIDNPPGFSNKTLDCDGHIIQATKHGIRLTTNLKNSTIKNCVLKGMKYGMEITSLNNFTFQNITIQSSALDEAIFGKVNNNLTFSNIKIIGTSSSYGLGFHQARSTGLKLINFTITRLRIGLQIEDLSERFLIDKLKGASARIVLNSDYLEYQVVEPKLEQEELDVYYKLYSLAKQNITKNLIMIKFNVYCVRIIVFFPMEKLVNVKVE